MSAGDDGAPAPLPSRGDALTSGQRLVYVLTLGALVMLGPFTIDMYLPAFPEIAVEFGASEAAIQLTLTGTLIGFAIGQLVIGPLSDKVGRRGPLLFATALHICASVGVALAPDVLAMGILRVLQGFATAGGGVVAMATVRDLFQGQRLVRMLARLALVSGLGPILAPLIGSQLLRVVEWRGVFWFLAIWGAVMLVLAALLIVETRPKELRAGHANRSVGDRYRALFRDRVFIGTSLVGGFTFSAIFSYVSSSSFLFQDVFGLDAQQFGLVFGANSLGLALSNQISSRVMRRISPAWVIAVAITGMFLASVTIAVSGVLGGGLWSVIVPLFMLVCFAGATFPAVQVMALAPHGEEAGTAASILGAVNFGLSGAISPLVGVLGIGSAMSMGIVQAGALACAIVTLWIVVRPWTVPRIAD